MAQNYSKARNLRRKAERRIAALNKQIKEASNNNVKEHLQKSIERMHEAIQGTRTYSKETGKRIRTAAQVKAGMKALEELVDNIPLLSIGVKKRNRAFTMRINMASNKSFQGPTRNPEKTLGEEMAGITSDEVQAFYRATQRVWDKPNIDVENRNDAIISHYKKDVGTSDLQTIFEWVLSEQRTQDVLKAKKIIDNPEKYTDAEKKWAYEILSDNEAEIRYLPAVNAAAVADLSPVAPM